MYKTVDKVYKTIEKVYKTIDKVYKTIEKVYKIVDKVYKTVEKVYNTSPANPCSTLLKDDVLNLLSITSMFDAEIINRKMSDSCTLAY